MGFYSITTVNEGSTQNRLKIAETMVLGLKVENWHILDYFK